MILNTSFFAPTGNCFAVDFTNVSATTNVAISSEVFQNVRITNNSGNIVFMKVSTTSGSIVVPTNGAANSQAVFAVPTGQQTFINTGITSPGNVFISAIAPTGSTGTVYLETGSFI